MYYRSVDNDNYLVVNSTDNNSIKQYHDKWYGAYKINLSNEMIDSLKEGKIILYNNDEYSFEIRKE